MKIVKVSALALMAAVSTAQADVTLFGNVEQRLESTNGVWNINGDDNFVGVKASEDLGEGTSAFAVMSMDLDSETGSTATVRDQYVGLNFSGLNVQAGTFPSIEKAVISNTVDTFHGTSFTSDNAGRVDSAVAVMTDYNGINLGAAVIADNGNENKTDVYELTAGYNFGAFDLAGYYSKNQTTKAEVKAIAASMNIGDVGVGATAERTDAGVDTYTVVADYDFGNNTVRGGIENIENGVDSYIVELEHKFSKRVSAYANYSNDDDAATDSTSMVGLNYSF